jgi:hypothetical protein
MSELSQPMPGRGPHLKLALWFGVAGVIATLLLFPYLLAMMPLKFAMLRQSAQSGVLCLLLGWIGLVLGTRYGLDAPWLRAWVYRQPRDPAARPHWFIGLALGMLAGWLVIAISRLLPHPAATAAAPSLGWAWRGALASFYGGFVEEVECRLFLASLFVWLLARLHRRRARPWTFLAAIALAALLFGAGHLADHSAERAGRRRHRWAVLEMGTRTRDACALRCRPCTARGLAPGRQPVGTIQGRLAATICSCGKLNSPSFPSSPTTNRRPSRWASALASLRPCRTATRRTRLPSMAL